MLSLLRIVSLFGAFVFVAACDDSVPAVVPDAGGGLDSVPLLDTGRLGAVGGCVRGTTRVDLADAAAFRDAPTPWPQSSCPANSA
jgi:hypothetical protein